MPTSVVFLLAAVMAAFSQPCWSQASSGQYHDSHPTAPLTYDVASVRESTGGLPYTESRDDPPHAAIFHSTNLTLPELLSYADGIQVYQITGGPSWLRTTRFNIDAKSGEEQTRLLVSMNETEAKAAKRRMFKALLVERFHLQMHDDSRQGTVFEVLSGSAPAKLAAMKPDVEMRKDKVPDGDFKSMNVPDGYGLIGRNVQLQPVFEMFEELWQTPIIDRTGMSGVYDFEMSYGGINETRADSKWPILVTAVREQLGFEVHSTKGPVRLLVIDGVEHPSVD